MSNPAEDPILAAYLRKLRWALSALPDADRDAIVTETRSHLLDRIDAGASADQAVAALGDAEFYARDFLNAYTISAAISSRKLSQLLRALLHNIVRSAAVALAGIVIFIAWAIAIAGVHLSILKLFDPAHIGLWRGENFFFIGVIDDPSTGQELLGPWLPALALLFVVLAWALTHVLALWALRRLNSRL